MDKVARAPRRVLVAGAGMAGTAAAFAAARAGARVTVLIGPPGASSLASGAFDDSWPPRFARAEQGSTVSAGAGEPEAAAFFAALGLYEIPSSAVWLATLAGHFRPARGRDAALLDLGALPAGRVLVPRLDRSRWDADALCRAYSAHPFARDRGLVFEPIDAPILRFAYEHRLSNIDLARVHDEPERLAWVGGALAPHAARADASALLVGPWMAADARALEPLRRRLGKPIGETLSPPGGAAGARFERARDRLIESLGVDRSAGRLAALVRAGGTEGPVWSIRTDEGTTGEYDAVVLATGGLLGGGIAFAPLDAIPDAALAAAPAPSFVSGLPGVGVVGMRGRRVDPPGTPFGLMGEDFDLSTSAGRDAFARVGLLADARGRILGPELAAMPALFGAGELLADRRRCVAEAVRSGLVAGQAAAVESAAAA